MSLATDLPQAMPVLENPSGNAGVPLSKVAQGDAAAGKNYLGALGAKDAAGNLQFPLVNDNRELVISLESANVASLSGTAKVTGHASVEQDVVAVTLQATTEYRKIGWIVSCFRQAEFRLVHIADAEGTPVETELATILVGPGQYSNVGELSCLAFSSGGTGVQELKLVGINKEAVSDLRGTVSVEEIQS